MKLSGINRHEQWPWIGRAANDKLQASDADLIKETGLNAVRCSHYPQSKSFLERCDEIGLIVFEEAPGWQDIGNDTWKEVYIENVKEMISRDKNHPSILMWSLGNESASGCNFFKMTEVAHQMDSTRLVHYEGDFDMEYADVYSTMYTWLENPKKPFLMKDVIALSLIHI